MTKVARISYEDAAADVEGISDALETPVDRRIKPLVIGLIMWNIRTTGSCEGHADNERYPFPWVDIDKRDLRRLVELVQRQNHLRLHDGNINTNRWAIMPHLADEVRLIPLNTGRPLSEMQAGAVEFGEFLRDLPDEGNF